MMTNTMTARRTYEKHATAAEHGAWLVETVIDWQAIDSDLAYRTPTILRAVRDAVLIESYHPVNLARLMRATWDDIDAGVCFSLEAYEGFKHFHALRLYLDAVQHEPAISEDELMRTRSAAIDAEPAEYDLIPNLVEFMLSEHLAAYFFRRLADQAVEPVLKSLLTRIAADEVRHAQSAADL